MLFTLAIFTKHGYGGMIFFMLIETDSYDLSVESYKNPSLVKYKGVIYKYSFVISGRSLMKLMNVTR